MAVVVADLLQPLGPVDPSFYPDDAAPPATGAGTVLDRLQSYLTVAAARIAAAVALGTSYADVDKATRALALYRAYEDAYMIKISRPATLNDAALGLGSETYIQVQIKAFQAEAAKYLAEYQAEIVTVVSATTAAAHGATTTEIVW